MKIDYKNNKDVMDMMEKAPLYRKKDETFLRAVNESEVGTNLITYVKNPDGEGFRKESENIIDSTKVIARNNLVLGYKEDNTPIYNEWAIPRSEVMESYGQECIDTLTTNYQKYSKKKSVRLLELTPEVMTMLGLEGKKELPIDVSWSKEPMIALVGDFITPGGYSISKIDAQMQYQKVELKTVEDLQQNIQKLGEKNNTYKDVIKEKKTM